MNKQKIQEKFEQLKRVAEETVTILSSEVSDAVEQMITNFENQIRNTVEVEDRPGPEPETVSATHTYFTSFEDFISKVGNNRFSRDRKFFTTVKAPRTLTDGRTAYSLKLTTDSRTYAISIIVNIKDIESGYLGAVYQLNKPLPGENWLRGGDISDGKFTHETWMKIVSDIFSLEYS